MNRRTFLAACAAAPVVGVLPGKPEFAPAPMPPLVMWDEAVPFNEDMYDAIAYAMNMRPRWRSSEMFLPYMPAEEFIVEPKP